MPSPVWILGLVILAVAVVVARQQFYASARSRVPRPALLRQDSDPRVERARRKYLVVLGAAVVLAVWGILELPRT